MASNHVLRPLGCGSNLVNVQPRRVGSEDAPRLADPVKLCKDLLLDLHVLEHSLNYQIALSKILILGGWLNPGQNFVHSSLLLGPPFDAARVVLLDHCHPLVQSVLGDVHKHHLHTRFSATHCDATTHQPSADNTSGVQRARLLLETRNLRALALSKEHVLQSLGLVSLHQCGELCGLHLHTSREITVCRGQNTPNDGLRRDLASTGHAKLLGFLLDHSRISSLRLGRAQPSPGQVAARL
mmetsp:Transcript_22479/g.49152  ORF Transcript_22479/g.49152 Transcript_22479/m.49152 type:complete len:240 (-) Transcript_22479:629-1348(-)